jgi:hypothetical protein
MRDADSLRSSEVDLALDRFALAFTSDRFLLCWDVLRGRKIQAWKKIVINSLTSLEKQDSYMLHTFAIDFHHHPYLRQWSIPAGIADIDGATAHIVKWLTLEDQSLRTRSLCVSNILSL